MLTILGLLVAGVGIGGGCTWWHQYRSRPRRTPVQSVYEDSIAPRSPALPTRRAVAPPPKQWSKKVKGNGRAKPAQPLAPGLCACCGTSKSWLGSMHGPPISTGGQSLPPNQKALRAQLDAQLNAQVARPIVTPYYPGEYHVLNRRMIKS